MICALHDVDAGDFFGHRVLNLHARVHFDEVELAAVHIHQEFDGARAFIVRHVRKFSPKIADLVALCCAEDTGQGRAQPLFDCAAGQSSHAHTNDTCAMAVAQDLHLDVARAQIIFSR